jgi:hypothetical protein
MHVKSIILGCLVSSAMAATPGALDASFSPELRRPVMPDWAELAPDGKIRVGGEFERADGTVTGGLLEYGANGGVSREPAPGYLGFGGNVFLGLVRFQEARAFLLADGGMLLPSEEGNWLRTSAAGLPLGKAFPDLAAGERIRPQFEHNGKLWVVRRLVDGGQTLERRRSADGMLDSGFVPGADWPGEVLGAVPAANGGAWVLAGDPDAEWQFPGSAEDWPDQHVFQVRESGAMAGEARSLPGDRSARLLAAGGDELRVLLGPSRSRWQYWPRPETSIHTVEWRAADGTLERSQDFRLGLERGLVWAEGEDGSYVATAGDGVLSRYSADGVKDEAFTSPGRVRSVIALPGGNWLVDGTRRLNADGTPDDTWTVPRLDGPGTVSSLHPLPGGKVLVAGDFTTADGLVRKGLAVFFADGSPDPAFTADARVGEVMDMESAGDFIYLVTKEPVRLRADLRANLLKMRADGSLDESFAPSWLLGVSGSISSSLTILDDIHSVTAFKGGDLIVTAFGGNEVASTRVSRIKPGGTLDASFSRISSFEAPRRVLATADGGFVRGGVFHRGDGSVIRDLGREGFSIGPLVAWQGGVLFRETNNNAPNRVRLRLWKGKNWVAGFSAPTADASYGIVVAPGENGTLYAHASFGGSRPALRRLLPTGRLDAGFRTPVAGIRLRREAGDWWLAGSSGKLPYDPARHESEAGVTTLHWNGNRLWLGGEFNVIDGVPRDGLAAVHGGKAVRGTR